MDIRIDGKRYIEARSHKICSFDGEDLYYGDVVYDSKNGFYNIAVSHVDFKFHGAYFVGQDGRTVAVKNATRKEIKQCA